MSEVPGGEVRSGLMGRGVWGRLIWLGAFAIAMGLLEGICVIYLRRLLPVDGGAYVVPAVLNHVEVIREACTVVMLACVAWLAGVNALSRVTCFFYAFGIWDIVYYAGLWWLAGWPTSILEWDCLFLIPKAWHGPVLAPVLISLYFVAWCLWAHHREIRGTPLRVSAGVIGTQLLAFLVWYGSFVKESDWIRAHKGSYDGVSYSWGLFALGAVIGLAGIWWASRRARPGQKM